MTAFTLKRRAADWHWILRAAYALIAWPPSAARKWLRGELQWPNLTGKIFYLLAVGVAIFAEVTLGLWLATLTLLPLLEAAAWVFTQLSWVGKLTLLVFCILGTLTAAFLCGVEWIAESLGDGP